MHTSTSARTAPAVAANDRFRWRVVDIVVAAVLGVAVGLVFWGWNTVGGLWFVAMDGLTPGLGGIAVGIWLIGGVIGGLVIRKPGAALLVELIAAIVSALIGNVWGITTVFSGLAQGLGAELIFLAFLYLRFTLPVAMLAGVGAGVGAWVLELFLTPNLAKSLEFNLIYLGTLAVSGALLAGLVGWLLVRALAATGALSRFAAGREARRDI
ncbi:ECF transporter S component [Microbacterium trichothecenolyticum]|uniref:Energy-coupling factor transport system substrate-specific component n=1 Tax=Microbacterium trichothecenolyticum TaxID=69370 RepID=A0ABU0TX91_MICTR|nr:ECF transporter S component [Microbacterium trichothecenolyticum]MDQ1124278.1 energy-coupling factor transport system substrate-specific component [Microbacterium trichothecenolyticum]